jgi:hypothetical protein
VVRGRVETAVKNARISGVITPANNRSAWSAIFVVSTIRKVAVDRGLEAELNGQHLGKNFLLLGNEGHRIYVAEAFRRRQRGIAGTYHSFKIAERAVQVGDVVVQDRQANAIQDVWPYDDIPDLSAQGRAMHCDIVVEIAPGGDSVIAIGGNLGGSVRRRRYPVDGDGMLVVDRERRYTQESDAGDLPPVPVPNPAAGLADMSTGRIFALLSLVEACAVIPGQQMGQDTVIA